MTAATMGKFVGSKYYHSSGRCDDQGKDVFLMRRKPTTLTNAVSLWLAISVTILGFTSDVVLGAAAENDMQYKEYWYKTEQMCPDLQESTSGKDIDTANYPYKSVFHSESYPGLPCILEAKGPQGLVNTVLIEAIHVDNRAWNYSGAQKCDDHIKIRLPEPTFLKRSNVPRIICRIQKSGTGSKEAPGSLYHPYLWQFQKGKLGLSFSSLNLSHLVQPEINSTIANHTQQQQQQQQQQPPTPINGRNLWLEPSEDGSQFVQIVFTNRFGGECTLRVQQYIVDTKKTCQEVQQRSPFRLCGLYDCSEKESILRTLGFWTHRTILVQTKHELDTFFHADGIPMWRREDPSYLEILVSTLRALIMPLLFLSVFYVTRRLRLKLASRNRGNSRSLGLDRHRSVLRQCYLRNLMRDGRNNNSSSESSERMLRPSLILNHVVYDVPVNGEYPACEDLPPPYETIVQPPSYLEATTTVKSTPSPVATTAVAIPSLPSQSTHLNDASPSSGDDGGYTEESNGSDPNIVPENQTVEDEETVQLLNPQQLPPRHQITSTSSANVSTLNLPV